MIGLMALPQRRIKVLKAKSWNTLFAEGGKEKKPSRHVNSPNASNEFSSYVSIRRIKKNGKSEHCSSYYVLPKKGIAEEIGKTLVVSGHLHWQVIVFDADRMADIYVRYDHILASRFVARVMLKTLPKDFPKS
jgi:P pilus assembly chaperone PapD